MGPGNCQLKGFLNRTTDDEFCPGSALMLSKYIDMPVISENALMQPREKSKGNSRFRYC